MARSRLLLNASMMIGVAVAVAAGWTFTSRGDDQNSAHARVASAIDEVTATLNIKPRATELMSDKAMRVRAALTQGDYFTAHQVTADVLANSRLQNWRYFPFGDFINGIIDLNDAGLEARLDGWVSQSKNDAMPILIRAQFDYQMGWLKRGHDFISATPAASLASFESYMKKGLADVDAAIRLDDHNPYAFHLKLRILRGYGMSQGMKNAFAAAIAKYPGYYPLYDLALGTLEPRWGGTVKAMYAFVDQYAGHAAEFSPLKLLHLSLYRLLLRSASTACGAERNDADRMAQCMASEMQRNVTPELERQVLAALQLYDHVDKYEFGVAVEENLSEMLRTTGGAVYSGAILQLAATSMHSDTQLKEDKPGRNNYVIDKAVSQSWYIKKFYDNALKKDLEALKDVEAMAFPSAEEKDLAASKIYESLAWTYDKLNQYTEMIAYEQAAVRLSGKAPSEYLICYGYYRLQDYVGAVPVCTKTVDGDAGMMEARYWRGKAYWELGELAAASADLTAVADSENGLRGYAARDLQMVYFKRDDIQGVLKNVLNKYAYLYDPKQNSRDNVAVSYNNRCYAYMQLDELQKALDDCTASLRYGSLPDAYRKQQELTKRLRAEAKPL